MSDTAMEFRRALADTIGSPDWRKALEAVPRELFVGDAVYWPDETRGGLWVPVQRAEVG